MKIEIPQEAISEIVKADLYDVLDTLEKGYTEVDPIALGEVLKYYTKPNEHAEIDRRVKAILEGYEE